MPTVVLEKYSFLESPRRRDGRIWVSDFYTHRVLSAREDGADVRVEAEVAGRPSGLGWLPDGRLLIVSMRDHRVLRREPDGELVTHADLSAHATGPLNDMLVDLDGRAYVGNFGFDLMTGAPVHPASLVRIDPDGTVTVAATDLSFPNGAALINGELVVAETLGNRISAFPVDFDGTLGARRDWARFGEHPTSTSVPEVLGALAVAPDGMCADVEGAVWAADALGNRAVRVRPQGEIVDTVDVGTGVYACALGGDDGRTLFLCTAPGFAEHERRDTREAALLSVRVDVPAA
jgi:sugar lactone lactonase YvrE